VPAQTARRCSEDTALLCGPAFTALIPVLAANTSYADFPRLASILARDKFLPHQFTFRGDRLAFSNGILVLGVAASALVVAFQADVTKLIPLYAFGVFVSFTLSQAGMVIHWRRLKELAGAAALRSTLWGSLIGRRLTWAVQSSVTAPDPKVAMGVPAPVLTISRQLASASIAGCASLRTRPSPGLRTARP
jgi:amino acid transporter